MPRIRKKTSNRGTTNNRKKIQQKVRESRKKAKKSAKNNPQWKSKKPKDPGIPNNFPFKDQILAEVAEQRRSDAAEKSRKKEERKALRVKLSNSTARDEEIGNEEGQTGESVSIELEELTGLQVGNDAVGGIGTKQLLNAKVFSGPAPTLKHDNDEDTEAIPVLINQDLPTLQAVLDDSDVIIQILDARDPLPFRSSHIEELCAAKPGRRVLFVLNKIDTCPRESVAAWASHLRVQHPTLLFRSAAAFLPTIPETSAKVKGKGKAKARFDDGLGVDSVLACLEEWARAKKHHQALTVAVVGVTNVGKSSFINSLIQGNPLPVYTIETSSRGPTTTENPQEVTLEASGKQIRLIDTPGLLWEIDESVENIEDIRARDILLRSKGRIDRLKDPTSVVSSIVTRSSTEDLMLFYSLPAFARGDPASFLSGIARTHQLVKKRGNLDLIGASRILLRDWSTGKFARYTNPPSGPNTSQETDAMLKKLYGSDAIILESLTPRKELRKSSGLVKLISGEIDTRRVVLQESWLQEDGSGTESDNEVTEMQVEGALQGGEDDGQDDEGEDGEDEDEDDEISPTPPLVKSQKRKRTNEPPIAPSSKKVTFAPDPKASKQARKEGTLKGRAEGKSSVKAKSLVATASNRQPPPKPPLRKKQKVANVTEKGERISKIASADDDTYDFSKFF